MPDTMAVATRLVRSLSDKQRDALLLLYVSSSLDDNPMGALDAIEQIKEKFPIKEKTDE